MYAGSNWTDERVNLLKKLWDERKSCSQIAEIIGGVTRNAVIGKVSRLGLPMRGGPGGSGAVRKPKPPRIEREPKIKLAPLPKSLMPNFVPFAESRNLTILEIGAGECRYPTTQDSPFLFCGHQQQSESSYCGFHHRLAYQPMQEPKKKERRPLYRVAA
jgi:GcrA cell cycle regulator